MPIFVLCVRAYVDGFPFLRDWISSTARCGERMHECCDDRDEANGQFFVLFVFETEIVWKPNENGIDIRWTLLASNTRLKYLSHFDSVQFQCHFSIPFLLFDCECICGMANEVWNDWWIYPCWFRNGKQCDHFIIWSIANAHTQKKRNQNGKYQSKVKNINNHRHANRGNSLMAIYWRENSEYRTPFFTMDSFLTFFHLIRRKIRSFRSIECVAVPFDQIKLNSIWIVDVFAFGAVRHCVVRVRAQRTTLKTIVKKFFVFP